jgi:hypothetical protein
MGHFVHLFDDSSFLSRIVYKYQYVFQSQSFTARHVQKVNMLWRKGPFVVAICGAQ